MIYKLYTFYNWKETQNFKFAHLLTENLKEKVYCLLTDRQKDSPITFTILKQ